MAFPFISDNLRSEHEGTRHHIIWICVFFLSLYSLFIARFHCSTRNIQYWFIVKHAWSFVQLDLLPMWLTFLLNTSTSDHISRHNYGFNCPTWERGSAVSIRLIRQLIKSCRGNHWTDDDRNENKPGGQFMVRGWHWTTVALSWEHQHFSHGATCWWKEIWIIMSQPFFFCDAGAEGYCYTGCAYCIENFKYCTITILVWWLYAPKFRAKWSGIVKLKHSTIFSYFGFSEFCPLMLSGAKYELPIADYIRSWAVNSAVIISPQQWVPNVLIYWLLSPVPVTTFRFKRGFQCIQKAMPIAFQSGDKGFV